MRERGVKATMMEKLNLRGQKRGSQRQRLHHWRAQYVQQMVQIHFCVK